MKLNLPRKGERTCFVNKSTLKEPIRRSKSNYLSNLITRARVRFIKYEQQRLQKRGMAMNEYFLLVVRRLSAMLLRCPSTLISPYPGTHPDLGAETLRTHSISSTITLRYLILVNLSECSLQLLILLC